MKVLDRIRMYEVYLMCSFEGTIYSFRQGCGEVVSQGSPKPLVGVRFSPPLLLIIASNVRTFQAFFFYFERLIRRSSQNYKEDYHIKELLEKLLQYKKRIIIIYEFQKDSFYVGIKMQKLSFYIFGGFKKYIFKYKDLYFEIITVKISEKIL